MDVFTIADFFGVQSAATMMVDVLEEELMKVAKNVSIEYRSFGSVEMSEEFVDKFFAAVGIAYSFGTEYSGPLRRVFVEFFQKTRFMVGRDERFRKHLKQLPEFAADVLLLLIPGQYEKENSSAVLFELPKKCDGCGSTKCQYFPYSWTYVSHGNSGYGNARIQPKGICEKCAKYYTKESATKKFLGEKAIDSSSDSDED
jgi:hypothetical protein